MAIQIKHATTAVGTEAGDGEIGKTEWNEAHTLTLETGKLLGRTTAGYGAVEEVALLDEDDMVSDSATAVPTQQSVKAYVDAEIAAAPSVTGLSEIIIITATQAFTKASYSGAKAFEVWAIGAGADGLNATGSTSNTTYGGHGGGSGGVAYGIIAEGDLASSVTVTIDGTSSSFAHTTSLVGNVGSSSTGGTATGGDMNIKGQDGLPGQLVQASANDVAAGGTGGSTPFGWGMGGANGLPGNDGGDATGYGAGGGGAGSGSGNPGTRSPGSGAPGAVIIKVHY